MTAAAIFESLRPNDAWAQQVSKDDKRIQDVWPTRRLATAHFIAFAPDGQTAPAATRATTRRMRSSSATSTVSK